MSLPPPRLRVCPHFFGPVAAQNNKTLTYLNLNVNQLTDEDSQVVLAALEKNTTLKEFTAYNNGAVDKNTRKKLRGFKK